MHTILICDDDKDIVSALDIYLTSEGYKTLRAYNGKEALQAVEQNEGHLNLMDIMMPGVDGIRATGKPRGGGRMAGSHAERRGPGAGAGAAPPVCALPRRKGEVLHTKFTIVC